MSTLVSTLPQPFARDAIHGLSQPQKSLPSQYFYDERGSELFEQITEQPEYYPTRTELALLETCAPEIAETIGPNASIVEYGAGAQRKIRILLDQLKSPAAYIPIDVSGPFLRQAADVLDEDYAALDARPVVGSFMSDSLAVEHPDDADARVGFFPGSTLGNLSDDAIVTFLSQVRSHLGKSPRFLLGVDINQDVGTLIPAYNDAADITAAFNLNLLVRMNRELEANFDVTAFRHEARWNADAHRIEMHLISEKAQSVSVAGQTFTFAPEETIHTENSRKFTRDMLDSLCARSGWTISHEWASPGRMMGLYWMEGEPDLK